MAYLSDIEIAQSCKMKPISEIAEKIGLTDEYLEPYGKYKAKIDLSYLKNNKKLINISKSLINAWEASNIDKVIPLENILNK